ncbi:MAG TPA: hypothetical protein H9909_16830 [Candidatus Mediterraneibacter norfolkensis]|nr:hypothetical protein [Candidatus Mediterraneibacter norfolkensis]
MDKVVIYINGKGGNAEDMANKGFPHRCEDDQESGQIPDHQLLYLVSHLI